MSTAEQKALELADRLQQDFNSEYINWDNVIEAVTELRRLSAENEAQRSDLEAERAAFKTCAQERYNYHANLVDMRYQLTAVTNERDALRAQVEALTRDTERQASKITELCAELEDREARHRIDRQRLQTIQEHRLKECWYWQGDGQDHLESLVGSLPVVIRADQLRALTRPAVPEGWKLVPVEPTTEMLRAGDKNTWALPAINCWRAMLASAPQPPYKDSTPHLSVGESSFESWYSTYNPAHKGDKQRARDAYAAGMGDPLVQAAPQPEAQPTVPHANCPAPVDEIEAAEREHMGCAHCKTGIYAEAQPAEVGVAIPGWTESDALAILNRISDGPFGQADVDDALEFMRHVDDQRQMKILAAVDEAQPTEAAQPTDWRAAFDVWWSENRVKTHNLRSAEGFSRKAFHAGVLAAQKGGV